MNEHIDLTKILKDCQEGTKLYSPVFGDVEFVKVCQNDSVDFPIEFKLSDNSLDSITKDGRLYEEFNGECLLFPSREQRDWSKFKPKKKKFDPKTLKSFDKVLVKLCKHSVWGCTLFSHYINNSFDDCPYYVCINIRYKYCIPYNEETKHLVGTTEEAPEYYRYWEE